MLEPEHVGRRLAFNRRILAVRPTKMPVRVKTGSNPHYSTVHRGLPHVHGTLLTHTMCAHRLDLGQAHVPRLPGHHGVHAQTTQARAHRHGHLLCPLIAVQLIRVLDLDQVQESEVRDSSDHECERLRPPSVQCTGNT